VGQAPALHNLPFSQNDSFTGRTQVLEHLHATLKICGKVALKGLGGIGKTQIAAEYAYKYKNHYKDILWAKAESRATLISDFVTLASLLDLIGRSAEEQNVALALVKRQTTSTWLQESITAEQNVALALVKHWLGVHTDWLLILDDANDPKLVGDFLPPNPKGHIVLTSQASSFDHLGVMSPIEVEKMLPDEARDFFYKRTNRYSLDPGELQAVGALIQELDALPLALEQAGAYIAAKPARFQDYLVSYRNRGLKLLEQAKPVTGGYTKSVATAWSLNFEQVEETSKAAADLLHVSAFFSPDRIPLELISMGAAEFGPKLATALANVDSNPLALDEVLAPLTQFSLIRRDLDARTFDLHRLVQVVLKDGMDEATQRHWAERLVRVMCSAFVKPESSTWSHYERLLPHAQACTKLIETWGLESPEAADLLTQIGSYLHTRGRFDAVEPFLQRAIVMQKKILGEAHPDLADSLWNLTFLYRDQGKYAQAERLCRQALTIWQQAEDASYTKAIVAALNMLGGLSYAQGKYAEAEPLFRQALTTLESTLGLVHLSVTSCLSGLAQLYEERGQYVQAESLYQQVLGIFERDLEPEALIVAFSLNNLAQLYFKQQRYAEAEPLLLRSLTIRKNCVGFEHPHVATCLNSLALLYHYQERYAEAEQRFLQALEMREKTLEAGHWYIGQSLKNLAAHYRDRGRYAKAEPLFQRALDIQEQALEPNHPEIANTLSHFASLYYNQGRYARAEPLYQRALAIREKIPEFKHRELLDSLSALANLYYMQDEYAKAEPLYQRLYTLVKQTPPPEYLLRVAAGLESYADLLQKARRQGRAKKVRTLAAAMHAKHTRTHPRS
jgi:tetratricopeptide (TPR) repeat protein